MSLYFDGFFACDLKPDTPQHIIDTLRYLTRTEDYAFEPLSDHDFFDGDDWRAFLQPDDDWACAPGLVWSDFRQAYRYTQYGEDVYRATISFRRTMHDDVEFYILWFAFLDWIAPYSETVGFVGYYRESFSLHPTLVYFNHGNIYKVDITEMPIGIGGQGWNDV
jgi:hypothetical protein